MHRLIHHRQRSITGFLSELAKDASYDSKDTEFLKLQLEELQNIKLLIENETQWTSERLVSSVTLVN